MDAVGPISDRLWLQLLLFQSRTFKYLEIIRFRPLLRLNSLSVHHFEFYVA